ncbi:hypothetical protein LZ31DRAFT_547310 [Colletotrichum somersetense]|nr:hypothetical protein LZ31DRAFT_547310 [Colletotrichum somersetense]
MMRGQHLVCFIGELMALGGKLFDRTDEVGVARKLVDGYVYTYESFHHGVMPETFYMAPCPSKNASEWDESLWKTHILQRAKNDPNNSAERNADDIVKEERLVRRSSAVPDRRYLLTRQCVM